MSITIELAPPTCSLCGSRLLYQGNGRWSCANHPMLAFWTIPIEGETGVRDAEGVRPDGDAGDRDADATGGRGYPDPGVYRAEGHVILAERNRSAVPAPGADPVYETQSKVRSFIYGQWGHAGDERVRPALEALDWLAGLDRCPHGCPKCAAEYLDAKEREARDA